MEELWETQRKAYVESAEEVLGFRKGKSKPWISQRGYGTGSGNSKGRTIRR